MLSCDAVRERLPGLVTGETPTPEEREHLARCEDCREEREAQAKHVERVREGLTSLAPSPLLEDAVLDLAARAAEEPPRRPWLYVAAAAVAAAALFLVVILPRLDLGARTDGDGDGQAVEEADRPDEDASLGQASVGFVPTAAELDWARGKSHFDLASTISWSPLRFASGDPDAGSPGAMKHSIWVNGSGERHVEETTEFHAPPPGAIHRFVYRDPAGEVGSRLVPGLDRPREEGLIVLGSALLDAIGGTYEAGATPGIRLGDQAWRPTPGTMQGEITLASPDAGGASARVRVQLNPNYGGTLLLEGPLARALDLHFFEIPGGVVFNGPTGHPSQIRGHRARARVRIPELGVDRVVEVQIVEPRRPKRGRPQPDEPRGIRLEGELPALVYYGHEREYLPELGTWSTEIEKALTQDLAAFDPGDGTTHLVLTYGIDPAGLPLFPDVPILGELFREKMEDLSEVVPHPVDVRRGDVHTFEVENLEIGGSWEPGAHATIARAWRGTEARASAEAVAWTKVKPDGRLIFKRIRGEPGATLRMLVTTKDGTSTFHDLIVAPELLPQPRLPIDIRADGTVEPVGPHAVKVNVFEPPWQGDERTAMRADRTPLRTWLLAHAGRPEMRDERRDSTWLVDLRVEKAAPWRLVQWVLETCADPEIRIRHFRLVLVDAPAAPLPLVLPIDPGITGGEEPPAEGGLRITLKREAAGDPLAYRVRNLGRAGGEVLWRPDQLDLTLGDAITAVRGERTGLTVEIAVAAPGLATAREVRRVVEACLGAEFRPEEVLFASALSR